MKMASTLIDLISKKQIARAAHFSVFPLPFSLTKTSNFLVTHYFHGGTVVCAYPIFVSCVYVRFDFSLPLIFTLLAAPFWPLAFLIFSPPL